MNDINENLTVYDLSDLQPEEGKKYQVPQWLMRHKSEIVDMIDSRIDTVINTGVEKKVISEAALQYSSDQWKDIYYESNSINFKPYLPMLVYCVTRYQNQDCHSLVFGKRKPIVLPEPEKVFLDLYFRADEKVREKVIKYLEKGSGEPVNNISYVLKERMTEVAHKKGKGLMQIVAEATSSTLTRNSMLSLHNEQKKFYDKCIGKRLEVTQSCVLFVISAALRFDLSLDYLLLLDYSEADIVYSAEGGLHGFPDSWRGALGAYLRADIRVRKKVISQLMLQDMGFDISL